jgi:hypothetical protein
MSIGRIKGMKARGRSAYVVTWDDGYSADIDLRPIIAAHQVLAALADPDDFPIISDDGWSVEWQKSGIDLGAAQLRRWADEQAGEAMPAAAFRAWMEGHGLTLDRAAEALGLSRRIVAYYLSGEQPVPKTVMLATEGYDKRQAA